MIAFDIDGCINKSKEDAVCYGLKFFAGYQVAFNKDGYYLKDVFQGAPPQAYEIFWQKFGYDIYTAPPLDGVKETVYMLKESNILACYITSRDTCKTFGGITFEQITSDWLKKYDIQLPVYYCKDKLQAAKALGVRLMVEDKPENILALRDFTDVIIFRHGYNRYIDGVSASSWSEIADILNKRYNFSTQITYLTKQ